MSSNYLPFGFTYPKGPNLPFNDANPDPAIETLRGRIQFLNECHGLSSLPGHIFTAAAKLLQERSPMDVDRFWSTMQTVFTPEETVQMVEALEPLVADEPPRLEFPNAIALVDCRFVSTLEWQHLRRYSIGGSDAAVVTGKVDENGDPIDGFTQLSRFQTRRGLYYEKQATFVEPENSWSKQHIFDYGHQVEPFVIEHAARELNAKRRPEYRMFAHKQYPFITCNPDGILEFPDGSLCLFEAKTATHHKKEEWQKGIPEYYTPQPRQYMEVLNDERISFGYIGCCMGCGKYDFVMHKYERNKVLGQKQMEQIATYWQNYIAAGVVPPLSGNAELDKEAIYSYELNQRAIGAAGSVSGNLPADSEALVRMYQQLAECKKDLTKDYNKIYTLESDYKHAISAQVPEGLTVVQKPSEVCYRISFKKSRISTVSGPDLKATNPAAYEMLSSISETMKDAEISFSTPKVKVLAATKTTKKKGATA